MKSFIFVVFCIMFAFSSCKQKNTNVFCEECKEIIDTENPIELQPYTIMLEDSLLAGNDVTVIGGKEKRLLITSLDDKEAVFHLYDVEGHLLMTFGKIGKSESEFTGGAMVTDQVEGNDVYVNDVNTCTLKVLDIDSILLSRRCVVKKKFKTVPRALNVFCVNDTLLFYEQETLDNYRLCRKSIPNAAKYHSIELYKPCTKPSSVYQSKMSFDKERSVIVAAMRNKAQVNFYNIESGKRQAVKVLRDKTASQENGSESHEYYCDISTNSQYIYALYMDQSSDDAYEKEKNMEIHVFDWDGNYLKSLKTNNYIVKISVDKENKWLYGLDLNGNVYKYSLNNM